MNILLLLSVYFEKFNSINERTTFKFSGMTLLAFIITSVKFQLKSLSAIFFIPYDFIKLLLLNC